jgi:L-ribulokinase
MVVYHPRTSDPWIRFAGVPREQISHPDHIAGRLSDEWSRRLGLRAGIPIPVGAFDAHWDAVGAGIQEGDVVNVVGTSTCIIAIAKQADCVPGVCGVVPGSVHPDYVGVEAGLSAVGDIFEAIARRAGTTVRVLSNGLEEYRAGQTGLLRLTWDNGDRTVLVNPELGGITLGWRLTNTAQDELFAAIEGTAAHARRSERMETRCADSSQIAVGDSAEERRAESRVRDVFGVPVLVPERPITRLG